MQHNAEKARLHAVIETELKDIQPSHYHLHTSPIFWMRVFMRFWNDIPTDHEDPRWDRILHKAGLGGLEYFGQLLKQQERWKKRRAA